MALCILNYHTCQCAATWKLDVLRITVTWLLNCGETFCTVDLKFKNNIAYIHLCTEIGRQPIDCLSQAGSRESPTELWWLTSEAANHEGGLRCCHSNQARWPHVRMRAVRTVAHVPEHYMYTEIGCSISSPVDWGGGCNHSYRPTGQSVICSRCGFKAITIPCSLLNIWRPPRGCRGDYDTPATPIHEQQLANMP